MRVNGRLLPAVLTLFTRRAEHLVKSLRNRGQRASESRQKMPFSRIAGAAAIPILTL
jgi:hypothetical protein